MRRSKYWYICVSHLPGWYFKSCNIGIVWFLQRCSFIVGKTFGFWSHRLFGKAFIKSVLLRNILFLHKKTLDPPFIKTVFLAFPLSVIIFFISVFWVFWEGQSSQLTRGGGANYGIPQKASTPCITRFLSVHFLPDRDTKGYFPVFNCREVNCRIFIFSTHLNLLAHPHTLYRNFDDYETPPNYCQLPSPISLKEDAKKILFVKVEGSKATLSNTGRFYHRRLWK